MDAENTPQYAELDLPLIHAGKVRELYALPADDQLLMVASDAISAYDHVLSPAIPDKGKILTTMLLWWFDQLHEIVDNHIISKCVPDAVDGRAVIVEKLEMIPVECVARGYLTGSGWIEYQQTGTVCGVQLPEGLVDGSRLPEPIFTPATKAPLGEHDQNVTFEQVIETVGQDTAERIRDLTVKIYTVAESIARERGIILADTKLEFGKRADGTIVLADEVLTPDSSRFWDAESWLSGERLESFDKQYLRDWLVHQSGWGRSDDVAPPPLPPHIVDATRERYLAALERLSGSRRLHTSSGQAEAGDSVLPMAKVVVDVMPKAEILDPQGKTVTGALARLGHLGLSVRQGKRFEISVEGEITDELLAQVNDAAEKLLANTVIEEFVVRVEEG